ncbi:MAG TPA: MgtC/SapB family protein [Sediminibacterium sp.]|nr:MgtC/SapB family protein [Sediminibacterium sp.]
MSFDKEILLRFLLAALWGGIVGAERQYRTKSAGFRTMIMIALGACFFTMMSEWIAAPDNRDRIASNIVTGIGFLGAGVIFRGENRVNGITTAATIWAVAAVGMGIGAGYYWASACVSLLTCIVLAILPSLESYIGRLNLSRTYQLTCVFETALAEKYEMYLKQHRLHSRLVEQAKEDNQLRMTWEVQGHARNHDRYIAAMLVLPEVLKFEYH